MDIPKDPQTLVVITIVYIAIASLVGKVVTGLFISFRHREANNKSHIETLEGEQDFCSDNSDNH